MAKNYVRLDKLSASGHIETVLTKDAPLVAGQFVNLGKLLNGYGGEATDYTKAETGKGFDALVAPVFIDRGYPGFNLVEQEVAVGKPARALILVKGDVVSFNAENVTGGVVEGDNVTISANGLGLKKANGTSDVVVGKVIAKEQMTNVGELVVVRFA